MRARPSRVGRCAAASFAIRPRVANDSGGLPVTQLGMSHDTVLLVANIYTYSRSLQKYGLRLNCAPKILQRRAQKTSAKTPNGQKYRYRFEFAESQNVIGLAVSAFVIIMRRDSVE